jgi:pSer/pThr/pTyr-binding forkhead associated (FHA) protein
MGYYLQDSTGKQISVGLSMRIGTDPYGEVVLTDPRVAKCHAILGELPDGLLIRDEDSPGGTFINNEKIEHVIALKAGDQIKVGDTVLTVGTTNTLLSETKTPELSPISIAPPPLEKPDSPETIRPVLQENPPLSSKSPEHSQQTLQTPTPSVKQKKSGGCIRTGLTIILILLLTCVVLGGGGYLLVKTGIIPERMISATLGISQAQIQIYNFTDQTVYVRIQTKFDDETTVTMPHVYWTLAPYDSNADLAFEGTGERDIMTIGTTMDGNDLGNCIFVAEHAFTYNIVILPDKVLIDSVQYPEFMDKPPASGKELILATSSLCH